MSFTNSYLNDLCFNPEVVSVVSFILFTTKFQVTKAFVAICCLVVTFNILPFSLVDVGYNNLLLSDSLSHEPVPPATVTSTN